MPDKPKRHFLKAKEAKKLLDKASSRLGLTTEQLLKGKAGVEIVESGDTDIILVNGKQSFFQVGEGIYPTLTFVEYSLLAPKVVVDMGAVPFVCKGANIMAPGIRKFEGKFKKGDLVIVADEKYGKPIALGEILYDKEEIMNVKEGVVVRNIHFVGDKVWSLLKALTTTV